MWIIWLITAYLVGSFPTAYVVGRITAGIDIRQHGSGNVGGTNAARVLGLGPGLVVMVTDVLKAVIPTLIARLILGPNAALVYLIALAAILGHNWSIFLGFKGGKGVATTIGVSLVLFPVAMIIPILIAVVIILLTRYVSLGSLLLGVTLPIVLLFRHAPWFQILFAVVLCVLIFYRHRSNIARLARGTETRFSLGRATGKRL